MLLAESRSRIEAFELLAKSAKGAASVDLIAQATSAPPLFYFGELLQNPGINDLQKDPSHAKHYELLQLFAYGTYKDYISGSKAFRLNEAQTMKLRILTIATLASKQNVLSYDLMLSELHLKNVDELEDLIIEGMSEGVLLGELDQEGHVLYVEDVMGRDVPPSDLGSLEEDLKRWLQRAQSYMQDLKKASALADKLGAETKRISHSIEDALQGHKSTASEKEGMSMEIDSLAATRFGEGSTENLSMQKRSTKRPPPSGVSRQLQQPRR